MNLYCIFFYRKLGNVYWVIGSSCGGKTTSVDILSQKYGVYHYNSDKM